MLTSGGFYDPYNNFECVCVRTHAYIYLLYILLIITWMVSHQVIRSITTQMVNHQVTRLITTQGVNHHATQVLSIPYNIFFNFEYSLKTFSVCEVYCLCIFN